MSKVQVYVADIRDKGLTRLLDYLDERRLFDGHEEYISIDPTLYRSGSWMPFSLLPMDASSLLEGMEVNVSKKKLPLILNGSGSFHHLTYGFCRKIVDTFHEPYTIIHIDRHDDGSTRRYKSAESIGPVIDCGNFYPKLMADSPFALATVFVSSFLEIYSINENGKVTYLRQRIGRNNPKGMVALETNVKTKNIYVTVDLDTLSSQYVKTDWSTGGMDLEFLTNFLGELQRKKRIIGADICGLRKGGRVSTDILRSNCRTLETYTSVFSNLRQLLRNQK